MSTTIITIIGSIILAFISYVLGIAKSNRESEKLIAETKKLNLESQQKEIEVSESINEYYRKEMKNMLLEMAKLQVQVQKLSDEVKALSVVVEEKDKHIIALVEKCDMYEKKIRFQVAAAKGCVNRKAGQKCAVLDVDIK